MTSFHIANHDYVCQCEHTPTTFYFQPRWKAAYLLKAVKAVLAEAEGVISSRCRGMLILVEIVMPIEYDAGLHTVRSPTLSFSPVNFCSLWTMMHGEWALTVLLTLSYLFHNLLTKVISNYRANICELID